MLIIMLRRFSSHLRYNSHFFLSKYSHFEVGLTLALLWVEAFGIFLLQTFHRAQHSFFRCIFNFAQIVAFAKRRGFLSIYSFTELLACANLMNCDFSDPAFRWLVEQGPAPSAHHFWRWLTAFLSGLNLLIISESFTIVGLAHLQSGEADSYSFFLRLIDSSLFFFWTGLKLKGFQNRCIFMPGLVY